MTGKFEAAIKIESEVSLFLMIRLLGQMIWRLGHDAADKRIEDGPHINKQIKGMSSQIILIREQLKERFSLKVYADDKGNLSPEYMEWYNTWNNYIDNMHIKEWEALEAKINARQDTSDVKPPKK